MKFIDKVDEDKVHNTMRNQDSRKILTFCITGKDDDYMPDFRYRISSTINHLSRSINNLRQEKKIEILVTDWGSYPAMSESLQLSEEAGKVCRFIYVSPEVIRSTQGGKKYFHSSRATNVALRRANGEFVILFPADTLIQEHSLAQILRMLKGEIKLPVRIEETYFAIPRFQVPWQFIERQPTLAELDRHMFLLAKNTALEPTKYFSIFGSAGAIGMPRLLWRTLRGVDEMLTGWGWADIDLGLRASVKYSWLSLSAIGVFLYHMEHPPHSGRRKSELVKQNPQIFRDRICVNDEDWGLGDYEFEMKAPRVQQKPDHSLDHHRYDARSASIPKVASDLTGKSFEYTMPPDEEGHSVISLITWYARNYRPLRYLDLSVGNEGILPVASNCPSAEIYKVGPWKGTGLQESPITVIHILDSANFRGYVRFVNGEIYTAINRLEKSFFGQIEFDLIYSLSDEVNALPDEEICGLLSYLSPGGGLFIGCPSKKDFRRILGKMKSKYDEYTYYLCQDGKSGMVVAGQIAPREQNRDSQGKGNVVKQRVRRPEVSDRKSQEAAPLIMFISPYYPAFLSENYERNPEMAARTYREQLDNLLKCRFGDSDFYSHSMGVRGWKAVDIIPNCKPLQKRWAKEETVSGGLFDILVAQVRQLSPDVLYIQDMSIGTRRLIEAVRPFVGLMVGQIACPMAGSTYFPGFDIIFSSFPHYVAEFRKQGLTAFYQPLAFDPRVLANIGRPERDLSVTFIGGVSGHHRGGNKILESIAETVPIQFWGYGSDELPANSALRRAHRGEAWGLDMFRLLARSRITVNRHIDVAGNYANNMRLFEATGCGALLITDYRENLNELFTIGEEVVAYRSAEECAGLIQYYQEHPKEARSIAEAGRRRTLRHHTFNQRMAETDEILRRHLRRDTEERADSSPRARLDASKNGRAEDKPSSVYYAIDVKDKRNGGDRDGNKDIVDRQKEPGKAFSSRCRSLFNHGCDLLNKRRYVDALGHLDNAMYLEAGSDGLQYMRGICLASVGRMSEAMTALGVELGREAWSQPAKRLLRLVEQFKDLGKLFSIETIMTFLERVFICRAADKISENGIIVAINDPIGASICFLSEGAKKRNGQVFCIGGFEPDGIAGEGGKTCFERLQSNAADYSYMITTLSGSYQYEAEKFSDAIDMLFIDEDTSCERCRDNINLWVPKLKAKGCLIVNGYSRTVGVKRAVEECIIPIESCQGQVVENMYYTKI